MAKGRGIPVVFAIHNFAYTGLAAFADVDYCIVAVRVRAPALPGHASAWPARHCPIRSTGTASRLQTATPRFVTFVNPLPGERGVRVRPDRPRAGPAPAGYPAAGGREPRNARRHWPPAGSTRTRAVNIQIMPNTTDSAPVLVR